MRYRQVKRIGNFGLFEEFSRFATTPRFVVCKIIQNQEREISGKSIPASESIPGPNAWGTKAWTFLKLENAEERFAKLIEN